jgi:hypothetical protein
MSNPKTEPTDNTQKDPDQWVSGDDPMTGAQTSYLKTLCEQAGEPQAYNDKLTKAAGSRLQLVRSSRVTELPSPVSDCDH